MAFRINAVNRSFRKLSQQRLRGVQRLLGRDQERPLVHDAGLVGGDVGDRLTEHLGVVERDRRDHGDRCMQHVGGVEGAITQLAEHIQPPGPQGMVVFKCKVVKIRGADFRLICFEADAGRGIVVCVEVRLYDLSH